MDAVQKAERINFLGASEAAAACGVDQYKTRIQLWLEKTGQATPEDISLKINVQVGNHLEKLVLDTFEMVTGHTVTNRQLVVTSAIHSWMRATLDGQIFGKVPAVVEAKTAARRDKWGETGTDQIPQNYIIQVHQQMLLANVRKAYVPVIFGGTDFDWYEIDYDDELGNWIEDQCVAFWDKVQSRTQPVVETVDDIETVYKQDTGEMVEANDALVATVSKLREIKEAISVLKKDEEVMVNDLKKVIVDKSGLADQYGTALVTWKAPKAKLATDWEALAKAYLLTLSKEEQSRIVDAHTKPVIGSRRFLVK